MLKPGVGLFIVSIGAPEQKLVPYKPVKFHILEFSDVLIEFVEENVQISMRQIEPEGVFVSKRKQ